MNGYAATLNAAFIRTRRIELDLTVRAVADAVGLSLSGWRYIEAGENTDGLTLAQLGVLAELLAVPIIELLTPTGHGEESPAGPSENEDTLEQQLGAMLFVAGRAVAIGTLAELLETTTDQIQKAAADLRARLAPAGLVVNQHHAQLTLVPGRGSLRAAPLRDLLRRGEQRNSLPLPAARLLHRLTRGETLRPNPSQTDRMQLAALLRAGWARTGASLRSGAQGVEVHPDVRFSLALDEGYACQPSSATVREPPAGQKKLPWLDDDPTRAEGSLLHA